MIYKAKKSLGQHFLSDKNLAEEIVSFLPGLPDNDIIEIGPGKGILTDFLFKRFGKRLCLVELDSEFVIDLKYRFSPIAGRIIEGNALRINLSEISDHQIEVIGNFPYNISTQLIFYVLDNHEKVDVVLGMFQKEVAQRIHSSHGSKKYGILSVLFQAVYDVEYMLELGPESFNPRPKVDSAVIRCTHKKDYLPEYDPSVLHQVVKMAFNQRRKMMRNSLKSLPEFEKIKNSVLMTKRPEQVSLLQFEELALLLTNIRNELR